MDENWLGFSIHPSDKLVLAWCRENRTTSKTILHTHIGSSLQNNWIFWFTTWLMLQWPKVPANVGLISLGQWLLFFFFNKAKIENAPRFYSPSPPAILQREVKESWIFYLGWILPISCLDLTNNPIGAKGRNNILLEVRVQKEGLVALKQHLHSEPTKALLP